MQQLGTDAKPEKLKFNYVWGHKASLEQETKNCEVSFGTSLPEITELKKYYNQLKYSTADEPAEGQLT